MGLIKVDDPNNIESYDKYLEHSVYTVEKFKRTKRVRYLGYYCREDNGFYLNGYLNCYIDLPKNKQNYYVAKAKHDCKRFHKHLSDEDYLFYISYDFKLGITELPIESVSKDTPLGWYIDTKAV